MDKCCLIDVRNQVQFGITHLPNSVNIPFKMAIKDRCDELSQLCSSHEKVFIMCRRGVDSKDLTDKLLKDANLTNCVNVEGGISAWSK